MITIGKNTHFTPEQEAYIAAEVERRLKSTQQLKEQSDRILDRILTKIDKNSLGIKILIVVFVITKVAEYYFWHI